MPARCEEPSRLIGVLDLMGGVAVRAIGGRRDEYRPVQSRLCDSSDPRRIAEAFRRRYGIDELYVADLDAILQRGTNATVVDDLRRDGFRLTVDAGLRNADDAGRLLSTGVDTVVAALESLDSHQVLGELIERFEVSRFAFSLDLAGGVPLASPERWNRSHWTDEAPLQIARQAVDAGYERLIVLDLHAVGCGEGPATETICRELRSLLPGISLWTGGGVRSANDVQRLFGAGVQGVLVASALHDETL